MKRMLGAAMLLSMAAIMPAQQAAAQDPVGGAIVGGALGAIVGGAVGRGVEARKMLADDFLGPITVDRFRPGVPTEHVPFPIEAENRVVFNLFNQNAKTLFARAQCFPSPFALARR